MKRNRFFALALTAALAWTGGGCAHPFWRSPPTAGPPTGKPTLPAKEPAAAPVKRPPSDTLPSAKEAGMDSPRS